MAKEVAERRELAPIAPMLPTLGLGPALDNADVPLVVVLVRSSASLHHRGNGVHHCWVVGNRSFDSVSFKVANLVKGLEDQLTHNARQGELPLREGTSSPCIVVVGMGWGNPFGWKMGAAESKKAEPFVGREW